MENKVRYVLKHVLDDLYELGKKTKRGKLKKQMEALTGIKHSYFIHNSKTKVRYEQAVMKFADFMEENGIKREKHLEKVNTEQLQRLVDSYFKELANQGLSKSTIKIHIAALEKTLEVVRPDIKPFLEADENRIGWWSAGRDSRKRGSYVNPEAIIQRLSEGDRMIAEAQLIGGFRIREIARTEVIKDECKIVIHKAKGGRTRELDFTHRKEDFERLAQLVEKLKEQHYERRLKEYYRDLKNATKALGEEYRASHAFRYSYAERRIEKLKQNKEELKDLLDKYKINEDENREDHVLTQELGHNRVKMSRYYYR
jgi:hypothetical protein